MMTGRLYIDGKDAYSEWGVYVEENGWNELIAFPPLKTVEYNDWQEEDGIETDLSNPVLNTREVQIKFAVTYSYSRYFSLISRLSDGSYHTFDCIHIGRTFNLRLVSVPNFEAADILGFVTLRFADDFPLQDYRYADPKGSAVVPSSEKYQLDRHNLTDYGVHVLQGTLSEIVKTADVKQNMLRNIKAFSGAIYDSLNVTYKSKEVRLYCLMRAETLDELWRNWNALIYDLVRPEERELWVEDLEQEFPCYYKSCQVSEFYPDGKIWLSFTLTLVFTHDFQIEDDGLFLASESNIIIITEQGAYAIDLMPDRYEYDTMRLVNNRQTMRLTSDGNIRLNN